MFRLQQGQGKAPGAPRAGGQPEHIFGMRFGSLFTGIGGIDLGLERAGMKCVWQIEIDDYCRRVLEKHWPDVRRYADVAQCGAHNLESVDLICGGFPCQPWSLVGKRTGERDNRNLWPQMRRIVEDLRPVWVLGENVPGIGDYLDKICDDLEACGYEVLPLEIPAAAFGAPHLRYRTFVVAHLACARQPQRARLAGQTGQAGRSISAANSHKEQWSKEQRFTSQRQDIWAQSPEPGMGRVVHGLPPRVDRLARRRVAALGNAVVPQVAEWIARRIMQHEA